MGKRVGQRFAELLLYRERGSKRDVKVIHILVLIQNTLWKVCHSLEDGDLMADDGWFRCCLVKQPRRWQRAKTECTSVRPCTQHCHWLKSPLMTKAADMLTDVDLMVNKHCTL